MFLRNTFHFFVILSALIPTGTVAQSPPRAWTSSEIQAGIERLSVLGSVLYVAAHPDDENTAFLATMANGFGVRTGYLALTRGEGGQNLIGPEQGALLGLIRAQELLAAREIDGAEQFFTRAIDFGYSKTMEETLAFWGKDSILSDIVYVVRAFRPDVIVTRFTSGRGGHGNHTSSGQLALDAFEAAGDPEKFPEQLEYVGVWKPTRIVWNAFRFGGAESSGEAATSVSIDLGRYDPFLGVSYTELAGRARSMHKSQGFGASESRGEYRNSFEHLAGSPAAASLFDGVELTWNRIPGGQEIAERLQSVSTSFDSRDPSLAIPDLFDLLVRMKHLPADPLVQKKIRDVEDLILACSGLWIDVTTDRRTFVRGDSVSVTLLAVNRSQTEFRVRKWGPVNGPVFDEPGRILEPNRPYMERRAIYVETDRRYTQPFWLREPPEAFRYRVPEMEQTGLAKDPAEFCVRVRLSSPYGSFEVLRPVRFRTIDPVEGERFEPVRIVPRVSAEFQDPVTIFPDSEPKVLSLRVTANAPVRHLEGGILLPKGFSAEPHAFVADDLSEGDITTIRFRVWRTSDAQSGEALVTGSADGEPVHFFARSARYSHIPPVTVLEKAAAQLVAADAGTGSLTNVGYVMGAGDEVPDGLQQLGYTVTLLSDDDLLLGDLDRFGSIVTGVRAYNTRPALRAAEERLTSYMERGGTFVVQYMTTSRTGPTQIGPYPLTIGRDRVTDENAPMRWLEPGHPVFHTPNRIHPGDFDGWVQERGLYFAASWDDRYKPLLACSDPGEDELRGGLLFAPVGRGAFFYTGLSFFRQIPAGVPGAYRLLANIISYGRTTE